MKRRFTVLGKEIDAFIRYKRALGYRYVTQERILRQFDRYAFQVLKPVARHPNLQRLLQSWLAQKRTRRAVTIKLEVGTIRQFCLFRRRRDPAGFVPDQEWFPQEVDSRCLPHIFSDDEIRTLLKRVARIPGSSTQRLSRRILVLTLYCTGLRFCEAARLCRGDLDLRRHLLWIRQSKGRTRLVPFGRDLAGEFVRYLSSRGNDVVTSDGPLFISSWGKRLSAQRISESVRKWLRMAGLKPDHGHSAPRPYDLRHSFAVNRLSRWYRSGINVNHRLPWLSIYMGHAGLLGTEVYLKTTPELLEYASKRFAARFRKGRRVPHESTQPHVNDLVGVVLPRIFAAYSRS